MKSNKHLISVHNLNTLLQAKKTNVKVLDASFYLAAANRNAREEYQQKRIPSALFFDVDKQFASDDPKWAHLPHMLPPPEKFEREAGKLGLTNKDEIYIYDTQGQFSAARAWFLFRLFGHEDVAIVDGGLPLWEKAGYPIETGKPQEPTPSEYKVLQYHPEMIKYLEDVKQNVETPQFQFVDARSNERFTGKVNEPRAGLKKGRAPGSFNVPFDALLKEDKTYKSPEEIKAIFEKAGVNVSDEQKQIVTSCGSGLTGCILYFALNSVVGRGNLSLYDGSWAEYGLPASHTKVEKDYE